MRSRLPVLLIVCVLSAFVGVRGGPAVAADDFRPFLEALKEIRYYDTVVDFLDRAAEDPRCPDEFKAVIDYEAGKALLEYAKTTRDLAFRQQLREEAATRLERFIQKHGDHSSAIDAYSLLGQMAIEDATLKIAQSKEEGKSDAERKALLDEARKLIEKGRPHLEKFLQLSRDRVADIRKKAATSTDRRLLDEKKEAENEYARARLLIVGVDFALAKTYTQDAKKQKELLQQAYDEYGKVYETFGDNFVAGPIARMYQGIVAAELGKNDEAVAIFKETLTLPGNVPAYQQILNQAMVNLLQQYQAQKKYTEALEEVAKWEEAVPGDARSTPTGLEVYFLAGEIAIAYAQSIEKKDADGARAAKGTARKYFEFVSRFSGPRRLEAAERLKGLVSASATGSEAPKTYVEAKDKGDFAFGQFTVAYAQLQDPKLDPKKAETLESDRETNRDAAIAAYLAALRMAGPENDAEELNEIRRRLVFLFWDAKEYYDAAVVGEYLARRQPQFAGAPKAAEIAVKAYRNLFIAAVKNGEDTSFERARMTDLAELVARNWGDRPEAGEAVLMLIDTALDSGDFETAEKYLDLLPENSAGRGRAELRLGQAIYTSYAKAASAPEAERPSAEALAEMRSRAQKILETGLQHAMAAAKAGGTIDYSLEYSILLLAQMYLSAGDAEKAVQLLDDPTIGPIGLIGKKHPSVALERFQEEVYKTALRAYVGTRQFDKAEECRQKLESLVASSGEGSASRLTALYVSLGRQLQDQIAQLKAEGKTDELDRVISGFTVFLKSIAQQGDEADFRSLSWVAETFYGLGKGLDPGGAELPEKAANYYKEAARTYLLMIKRCEEDPAFAPEALGADAQLNLKVRLAGCLRAMGQYESAMKLIVSVLETKETRLDAQIEAATIYQEWAEEPDKEDYYLYAIRGGVKKGNKYIVWGWGGIANRLVAYYDKYSDMFHQARYNLALCRMKLAQRKSGEEKEQLLEQARLDIARIYQLYPSMGGNEWYAKYDALYKKIEQLQGNRMPQGLAGLKKS
ncbi:hypothetical protein [Thermostilla marina]